MRVLGIPGSLRRDSHNRRLLRAAAALLPPDARLIEFTGLKAIPPFDEDDEATPGPAVERWREQIVRAVEHEKMFRREEPVLVAVSGGKDSLALWDALLEMGYETTGIIPGYCLDPFEHTFDATTIMYKHLPAAGGASA